MRGVAGRRREPVNPGREFAREEARRAGWPGARSARGGPRDSSHEPSPSGTLGASERRPRSGEARRSLPPGCPLSAPSHDATPPAPRPRP